MLSIFVRSIIDIIFVFFLLHSVGCHTTSVCSFTHDVTFNHFTEVVFVKFMHCGVALCFFVVNVFFVGRYVETL